jgi:hypothetical protein
MIGGGINFHTFFLSFSFNLFCNWHVAAGEYIYIISQRVFYEYITFFYGGCYLFFPYDGEEFKDFVFGERRSGIDGEDGEETIVDTHSAGDHAARVGELLFGIDYATFATCVYVGDLSIYFIDM